MREIKTWMELLMAFLMPSGFLSLLVLNWLKFDDIRALIQKASWCQGKAESRFRDRMGWVYNATAVVAMPKRLHKRGLVDLEEIAKIPKGLRIWMSLTFTAITVGILLMIVWGMVFIFPQGRHG